MILFNPVKVLLLTLILPILLAGSASVVCPTGDLNWDCVVDWKDLRIFAQQWLDPPGSCSGSDCADLDGSNGVNMSDFALLAENWFDAGSYTTISGTLANNTILDAASSPWHVTGNLTVPAGVTLTIEAGTIVLFDQSVTLTVNGGLAAEGTEFERIHFTRVPGASGHWNGMAFADTLEDNVLRFAEMEYGYDDACIRVDHARLLIENFTWAATNSKTLSLSHPSLIVRNSVFPDVSGYEPVRGSYITGNEYLIFEANTFGKTSGGSFDIIDFSGAQRPGPVMQVYNNIFLGGADDALDLDGTDAHIEGNVFMNFHKGHTGSSTSNAIATDTWGGITPHIVVARNIFIDSDHAVLLKNGAFLTAENNVFFASTIAAINFGEPESGAGPGGGAYLDGNIFWNNADVFQNLFEPPYPGYGPDTWPFVHQSILPAEFHYLGYGNIDDDPCLADPNGGDFNLLPGSPALGTGPNGLDMGAMVPAGASISGEPPAVTPLTEATLIIDGPGITHYKYRVNDGDWSSERSVVTPIELTGLVDGQSYTVYVIAKNSAGLWQSEDEATASNTWTVDISS